MFYFQLPPARTSLLEVRRWACGRRQVEGGREGGAEERVEEVPLAGNYLCSHWGSCGDLYFSLSLSPLLHLSLSGGEGGCGGIIWESLLANSAAASSLPEQRLHPNEASWEFLLDAETSSSLSLSLSLSRPLLLSLTLSLFLLPSVNQSLSPHSAPCWFPPSPLHLFLFPAPSSPFPFFCLGTRVQMTLLLHHAFRSRTTSFIWAFCASVSVITAKTKAVCETYS